MSLSSQIVITILPVLLVVLVQIFYSRFSKLLAQRIRETLREEGITDVTNQNTILQILEDTSLIEFVYTGLLTSVAALAVIVFSTTPVDMLAMFVLFMSISLICFCILPLVLKNRIGDLSHEFSNSELPFWERLFKNLGFSSNAGPLKLALYATSWGLLLFIAYLQFVH